VSALLVLVALTAPSRAFSAEVATVGLGTAGSYSVLAGQTVTNTGPSVLQRNLGVFPKDAVTGFPPGLVLGAIDRGDAVADQAQQDLTTAYNDAAGRPTNEDLTGEDLGGKTLIAGVNTFSSSAQLTGELTLDGEGDPKAVFIFQIGSTLTTASASSINLVRGAQSCNVFFQVGSSATLGTGTDFIGTILALTSISANSGATINGRLLARNGSVTLDNNVIRTPNCAAATSTPSTSTTPTATPSSEPSASDTPTATVTSSATDSPSPTPTATVTSSATSRPPTSRTPIATATETQSATDTLSASATQSRRASDVLTSSAPATQGTDAFDDRGPGPGDDLADTGTSALTSALGIGGALLLVVGGAILTVARIRSRPKGRH
jgi:type VI secretion system secreted protein VgrG